VEVVRLALAFLGAVFFAGAGAFVLALVLALAGAALERVGALTAERAGREARGGGGGGGGSPARGV
jgi:hypothetical protein